MENGERRKATGALLNEKEWHRLYIMDMIVFFAHG
jgi:hypothetical protein